MKWHRSGDCLYLFVVGEGVGVVDRCVVVAVVVAVDGVVFVTVVVDVDGRIVVAVVIDVVVVVSGGGDGVGSWRDEG